MFPLCGDEVELLAIFDTAGKCAEVFDDGQQVCGIAVQFFAGRPCCGAAGDVGGIQPREDAGVALGDRVDVGVVVVGIIQRQ